LIDAQLNWRKPGLELRYNKQGLQARTARCSSLLGGLPLDRGPVAAEAAGWTQHLLWWRQNPAGARRRGDQNHSNWGQSSTRRNQKRQYNFDQDGAKTMLAKAQTARSSRSRLLGRASCVEDRVTRTRRKSGPAVVQADVGEAVLQWHARRGFQHL